MFRSVRRYVDEAGIDDPVVCYQGAAVVDPGPGTFLLHETIPVELARRAIEALDEEGHPPNCYVDDDLYVSAHTAYSRRYAEFQQLPVTEVGDLVSWLERPPTKLVAVGEPDELLAVRFRLAERLGEAVSLVTSLPWLLEVGNPAVTKGTGLGFVAERLGFAPERTVAFGDGENDVPLLDWAGFGVAVGDAHPALAEQADMRCPGPELDGVVTVIEAYLDGSLDSRT
jgi:hypothetical protein